MNMYAGMVGQLVIVELFVLYIWFQVLLDTLRDKTVTDRTTLTKYNKLLLTSAGLVLNAFAITGIMVVRVLELIDNKLPLAGIILFYVVLAIANFMFILSATIGSNKRLLYIFFVVTIAWTTFVLSVGIA